MMEYLLQVKVGALVVLLFLTLIFGLIPARMKWFRDTSGTGKPVLNPKHTCLFFNFNAVVHVLYNVAYKPIIYICDHECDFPCVLDMFMCINVYIKWPYGCSVIRQTHQSHLIRTELKGTNIKQELTLYRFRCLSEEVKLVFCFNMLLKQILLLNMISNKKNTVIASSTKYYT